MPSGRKKHAERDAAFKLRIAELAGRAKKSGASGNVAKEVTKSQAALSALMAGIKGVGIALAGIAVVGVIALTVTLLAMAGVIALIVAGVRNTWTSLMQTSGYATELKQKFEELRSSVMMAFEPLISLAIPYIIQAVQWLINLLTIIQSIFAVLTGKKNDPDLCGWSIRISS